MEPSRFDSPFEPNLTRYLAAVLVGGAGFLLARPFGDTATYLAWLSVVALPLGALVGALSATRVTGRWALCVPAIWSLALVWPNGDLARVVVRPLAGFVVIYGLYLAGLGLGHFAGRRSAAWAWSAAVVALLASLPLAFGLGEAGRWPATSPRLARAALEASPVGWTLECSGWDWSHRSRGLYERSGVEFAPRHPHRFRRTGLAVLAVGLVLGGVALRKRALELRAAGVDPV